MKKNSFLNHLCENRKCLWPYTDRQVKRFGKKCLFCGAPILVVTNGNTGLPPFAASEKRGMSV